MTLEGIDTMTLKTLHLTFNDAVRGIEKIVAKVEPDYTYPQERTCYYFEHSGAPSCLVGHLLYENGITLADLLDYQEDAAENINAYSVTSLALRGLLRTDGPTLFYLGQVQTLQDGRMPWHQVVERTNREI